AKGYNRLGQLYQKTSAPAKAEDAYRQALAVRQQLVTAQPHVPDYRHSLVLIYGNLAIVHHTAGRQEQAETFFRKAQTDARQLVADHPGVAAYQITLGTVH